MATAPTRTDATLVRRLQARDGAAWEELYAEYQPRLRAFGYAGQATVIARFEPSTLRVLGIYFKGQDWRRGAR